LGDRIERLMRRERVFSARASSGGVAASAIVLCTLMLASSIAPRWIAFAQEQPLPEFEVASVKLATGDKPFVGIKSPGLFAADNSTVSGLIMEAYGVRNFQIESGPAWLHSDRYQITAKYNAVTRPQSYADWKPIDSMLRRLLEERFQLRVHSETKQKPVYTLSVSRTGQLRPSSCTPSADPIPAGPEICGYSRYGTAGGNRTLDWTGTTIADLVGFALPGILDRPVLDSTGLTGKYDIHLEWTPDQATGGLTGGLPAGAPQAQGDSTPISIFAAMQEAGLKLDSTTGPVEMIVVDHVEKPDAN